MGKISKVLYIDDIGDQISAEVAARELYYHNLMPYMDQLHDEYDAYESNLLKTKARIIGDHLVQHPELPSYPKMDTSRLSISSMKGTPTICVELISK